MSILIYGDDHEQLEFDAFVLRQAGFQTTTITNAERFLSICEEEGPDLVVIDVNSKEMDVLSLIARLRSDSNVLIMLVSPEREEEHILTVLDLGADEYLVKPHSPRMLAARVRNLLERARPIPLSALGPVTIQDLTLDPEERLLVTGKGSTVRLTNLEFRLLFLLMRNPDRVIPSETIVERVWGYAGGGEVSLVKNLVSRLRHKVEPDPASPRYIKTIPGIGYSFSPREEDDTG